VQVGFADGPLLVFPFEQFKIERTRIWRGPGSMAPNDEILSRFGITPSQV
jgi:hypothetical protein